MKSFYDIKTVDNSVKDVDTTSRRVKVVISEMMSKDLDNDVIDAGAYNKTLQERGPKSKNLIWHLTDHHPSLKSAVGKPIEIFSEGNQLVMVTDIPNTQWGSDMIEFYSKGAINQHSIGFKTLRSDPVGKGDDQYTLIKEIFLYEGSAVLWGANPNTPTLTVGKSLNKKDLTERYDVLRKCKNDGNFSDEIFPILEAQLKETEKQIIEYFTLQKDLLEATAPIIPIITQPDVTDFVKQLEIQNFLTALKS